MESKESPGSADTANSIRSRLTPSGPTPSDLTVTPATEGDRALLGNLMQLYLYDFAEFDDRQPDRDGRFEYRWLDAYATDNDRYAYVLRIGETPVGFALVRDTTVSDASEASPCHEMAEFFVLRTHRGRGIGRAAAQRILRLHPGSWRITEVARNAPAIAFWRTVIPVEFAETVLSDGSREQRF